MRPLFLYLFVVASSLLQLACDGPDTQQGQTATTDSMQPSQEVVEQVSEEAKPVYKAQEYHMPNELSYVKQKFDYLYHKFRPIGWSADGKFAYIDEPADEACGCYFFDLYIVDLRNDSTLYLFSYNDEGSGESLATVWDKNYKQFEQALQKHQIVQGPRVELLGREFVWHQDQYTSRVATQTAHDPDFKIDLVKSASFYLYRGKAKKQVSTWQSGPSEAILNLTLPGVLQSPFEGRIAFVVQEERRGYEGPPHVLSFRLIGAQLDKGFASN